MEMKTRITVNHLSESALGFSGNGVHTAFLSLSAAAARCGGVEMRRNSPLPSDILPAHTFGPLYWAARAIQGGATLIHAHATPETLIGQVAGAARFSPAFSRYLAAYYNSADLVVAMNPGLKARLRAMGVVAPIEIAPLPIDLSSFRPDPGLRRLGRERLGLGDREPVVLCAGQMIRRKGLPEFLELAGRHPEATFVWAGEIPFSVASDGYASFKALLRVPPRNVRFPGVFPLEIMPQVYNAADLFLFPSHQETFGLAIAEAAACGLPLILRDLECYRENFGSCYLRASGGAGFDAALRRALASPRRRRELSRRSLEMAEGLRPEPFIRRLDSIYQRLAAASRRALAHAGGIS
jgi:glycosyltransferase involved in cell wall biosynthesis